jgi:hypothetical protein
MVVPFELLIPAALFVCIHLLLAVRSSTLTDYLGAFVPISVIPGDEVTFVAMLICVVVLPNKA